MGESLSKMRRKNVKKLFLIATAALALGAAPAMAAPTGDIGNDKIFGAELNPFSLLFGMVDGSLEMKLPVPQFTAKAVVLWAPNIAWVTGVSALDLDATARFYYGPLLPMNLDGPLAFLKKGPLQGLYVGGGLSIHSWGYSTTGYSYSWFSPGIVLETGAKYFGQDFTWWPKNFYTELGLRGDIVLSNTWKDSAGNTWSGSTGYSYSPIHWVSSVGYAF